ncbi:MAG TPA: hypothetical protein VGN90_07665, partial [Pyrinomonadaceae bacterium]|nr:hypothetical protein [Pyrinomonadaceae bacterium]
MRLRFCLVISVFLAVAIAVVPQTPSGRHRASRPAVKPQPESQPTATTNSEPSPEPTVEPTPVEEAQAAETLKI